MRVDAPPKLIAQSATIKQAIDANFRCRRLMVDNRHIFTAQDFNNHGSNLWVLERLLGEQSARI